jgi:molybdopterin synthase catalytic subunit
LSGQVVRAEISAEPIDAAAHERLVAQASAGAVVTFCGAVRDHDGGRTVVSLEYVGHPSAAETVRAVAGRVAEMPGVLTVAVSHRVGTLAIGDTALIAVVSSAHREAAFSACARLVDELKRELPIWKRQVFGDGTDEWVNCP